MSALRHLQLPVSEADIRSIALGDLVLLTGDIVITAGLPTHQRIIEHIEGVGTCPMARPAPHSCISAAIVATPTMGSRCCI